MNEMTTLRRLVVPVDLGKNSYKIYIGSMRSFADELTALAGNRQVLLVTDANVEAAEHTDEACELLSNAFELGMIALRPGEKYKTLAAVGDICRFAAFNNFDRKSVFAALGGGVTGDMTGFAAAIYKRGVEFIQLPTTLLAMVDSSVGGKTGADLPEGKNLIGAFHQPKAVFMDPALLDTLPKKEWRNGLAEVIKYGVIFDAEFFNFLLENKQKLLKNPTGDFYAEVIKRCCEIKADVVRKDEFEGGIRAILNYGHTFGHAVELLSNFKVPHGKAVAFGMVLAGRFAVKRGEFNADEQLKIEALLDYLKLPVKCPCKVHAEKVLKAMHGDKKSEHGKIRLILPERLGKVRIADDVTDEEILTFLQDEL